MKNNLIKTALLSLAVLLLTASLSLAQDSTKHATHMMKMDKSMKMEGMKMSKDMKGMDMKSSSAKTDSSIIRTGVIDLKAIDKNKDGKVYEDVMDYNVISDKPGKCPICGMTLKKVSLAKAKSNLEKAGFKVK